jgi:hypothetical protein
MVLPIIAVEASAAGTTAAHRFKISAWDMVVLYSMRRLNAIASAPARVSGPLTSGRQTVQLCSGAFCMESGTGRSVATPDR